MQAPGTPLQTVRVKHGLSSGEVVELASDGEGLELVSAGTSLRDVTVVVDGGGTEAPPRVVGEIRVRGPIRFRGYWGDEAATAAALDGEWLCTGDLGFRHEGELYIAGRLKDVIIVRGRHYFPEEIEAVVAGAPGVRPRSALAFGEMDPSGGQEQIHLVVETELTGSEHDTLAQGIQRTLADHLDCRADVITFVAPRELPRTPSAKLQRGAARSRWGRGAR